MNVMIQSCRPSEMCKVNDSKAEEDEDCKHDVESLRSNLKREREIRGALSNVKIIEVTIVVVKWSQQLPFCSSFTLEIHLRIPPGL